MSHQSQPGQALDTNRKMYGRETEKAGSLLRLGRERERRHRRWSNWIRRPSGATEHPLPPHPRPNPRPGMRRGNSASTKPSSRPPLPFRPSPRVARRRGSECGGQESEAAGGAIGPNPRDTTERRQRQNRGGPSSTRRTTRAENQAQRRAPPSNTHRRHASGARTRSAVEYARFLLYSN